MKIVGAAFVLISSGGIGFLYAQQLIKRVREMEELYQLLKLILGDIRYMRTTLPEAVEKARKRHKGSFQTFLFEVEERLRGMRSLKIILKDLCLLQRCITFISKMHKASIPLILENCGIVTLTSITK